MTSECLSRGIVTKMCISCYEGLLAFCFHRGLLYLLYLGTYLGFEKESVHIVL